MLKERERPRRPVRVGGGVLILALSVLFLFFFLLRCLDDHQNDDEDDGDAEEIGQNIDKEEQEIFGEDTEALERAADGFLELIAEGLGLGRGELLYLGKREIEGGIAHIVVNGALRVGQGFDLILHVAETALDLEHFGHALRLFQHGKQALLLDTVGFQPVFVVVVALGEVIHIAVDLGDIADVGEPGEEGLIAFLRNPHFHVHRTIAVALAVQIVGIFRDDDAAERGDLLVQGIGCGVKILGFQRDIGGVDQLFLADGVLAVRAVAAFALVAVACGGRLEVADVIACRGGLGIVQVAAVAVGFVFSRSSTAGDERGAKKKCGCKDGKFLHGNAPFTFFGRSEIWTAHSWR